MASHAIALCNFRQHTSKKSCLLLSRYIYAKDDVQLQV